MSGFVVTKAAKRPASSREECFYCHVGIGGTHKEDCALLNQIARVKMTVTYDIKVPADWSEDMVVWHRTESSWCADNALDELRDLGKRGGCLCGRVDFECLEIGDVTFLDES